MSTTTTTAAATTTDAITASMMAKMKSPTPEQGSTACAIINKGTVCGCVWCSHNDGFFCKKEGA